jgi:predicted metal-dependent enzyme (double-stranded beta helix superfamily)
MDTLAPLRAFIHDIEAILRDGRDRVPERAAERMRALVVRDDWLPESMAAPHPQYYQQHLLYADPQDRFSLVSFVWGPGQKTPVHDHTTWGVIGMLRGAEFGQRYELVDGAAPRKLGPEGRLQPGDVEIVSPTHGDIHVVRNAFDDRVSISIHLYGGNIGRIRRHVYDAQNGQPKTFVSGYTRTLDRDALRESAPEDDSPVGYMQRTRDWYLALGFDNPYRYAHFADVPFTPLGKPLSQCTVALLTTAAPYRPDKGPQGPGAPYNAAAKFYVPYTMDTAVDHDVRISHVAIDRRHTSMEDSNSWFPLPLLRSLAASGRIGRLSARAYGVPTNRSQRHTLQEDIPVILQRCREDSVDVAVLVPNCPVCHQVMALTARALEASGIPTVILGCAKDIAEHVGVPRLLFSDFPLGNGAGKPHDARSQAATMELALRLLESAPGPRTTVQSPQRWSASHAWKADYCNIQRVPPEEIGRLREKAQAARATGKAIRDRSGVG